MHLFVNGREFPVAPDRVDGVFAIDLPDVEVPAGVPIEQLDRLKLVSFDAWWEVAMPCLLEIAIDLTALSEGQAELALVIRTTGGECQQVVNCCIDTRTPR